MNKSFFIFLFLALAAYGQQKRIAIVNTEDDGEPPLKNSELTHLTDKLREIANKTLPSEKYAVMTQQSIVAFLGSQENMIKECKESEGCLAKLGRKINADYIGQARIGRFGKDLAIKVELYESGSGNLINSFTAESKDIYGLLEVLNKEAPDLFKKLSKYQAVSVASPAIAPTPIPAPIPVPPTSTSASIPAPTQPAAVEYGQQLIDSRDGKKYKTVVIGKQTWMAENLNYEVKGFFGTSSEDSKCYDNKSSNCDIYGRLYIWTAAKKACPKGWHLPSDKDWNILMKFVNPSCSDNRACDGAGTKLKSTSGWNNGNGTDEYGFSALPGGHGNHIGMFEGVGNTGGWWSASEYDHLNAYGRSMSEDVSYSIIAKFFLSSVRCVKN